jgi:hypothetical protein
MPARSRPSRSGLLPLRARCSRCFDERRNSTPAYRRRLAPIAFELFFIAIGALIIIAIIYVAMEHIDLF